MTGDQLILKYDADDDLVWLIMKSPAGSELKEAVWLRTGFGIDDVHEAIKATGWVTRDGIAYRLTSDVSCHALRNIVDSMFNYFESPAVASRELLEIQAVVVESAPAETRPDIPLLAYAWLDLMVREDIADTARSDTNIWGGHSLVVELRKHREERVEKLLLRYGGLATNTQQRMAGSISSRKSARSTNAKTG